MKDRVTAAVQDYLKAIHTLGGVERTVIPADIALHLKVRAPSVTGMLRRLAEAGLIRYEVGKGAQLLSELICHEADYCTRPESSERATFESSLSPSQRTVAMPFAKIAVM